MYGAYPPKLSTTLDISSKKAQEIFDNFWSDDNPLNKVKSMLKREWSNKGYITGLDGRPIFIRKESALLNSNFQSSGAIVMKVSMVLLDYWVRKYNIDAMKVGDIHDEAQADVAEHHTKVYGSLAIESIRKAGRVLNLNVDLDSDYSVGESWAETH